jgi:hypothetical protein
LAETPEYKDRGTARFPGSPIDRRIKRAEAFNCPLFIRSINPFVNISAFAPGLDAGIDVLNNVSLICETQTMGESQKTIMTNDFTVLEI